MVPALLLIFLHMLLTGVAGNYHINAPPTFVSHDRRNLRSNPISGFISIDCGCELPEDTPDYKDEDTHIVYTSDAELIDTGESKKVLMNPNSNPKWKFLENVRSFPFGTKNCYTLQPDRGRDKTYLVRATFMYGNYDTKNSPPIFDLYLGPNLWDTITFDNVTHMVIKEIMHVFPLDFLDICLLNTNKGVPFISALELRHILNDTIYRSNLGSLETWVRYDYGRDITEPPVRYSEDAYDRIWYPVIWNTDLISINSLLTVDSLSDNEYKPPAMVMRTAVTPSSLNDSISIYWNPPDGQVGYYIYMHFAELKKLDKNREFVIDLNNERWMNEISPSHLQVVTVFSTASLKGLQLEFRIYATSESNLPPLLNAVELYKVRKFTQLPTQQDDVEAIINIKKFYTIKKHWQGDPCLPDENYMWDGLNCSYNGDNSPRIIMLNLSSSGIAGVIAEPLSKLSSLQHLDLSYNRMNGTIPEFLCQMTSLKILNLRGNNLTGSVPQVLTEKLKNHKLLLSLDDNPKLCSPLSCTKEKKNKDEKKNEYTNKKLIVVGAVSAAVSTAISLSTVLSVALAFSWKYNWTWDGGDGLPSDDQIGDTYNDERNPPGILRRTLNQVKKNFVKGQGQRQRPSIKGSGSQLTQSSNQSTPHTPVDYVKAICRDPALLRTLQTHLKALSPNDLGDTVATIASQQEKDQEHDKEATYQGKTTNWLDVATGDSFPDDDQRADTYNDERNPPGILRRMIDMVKKNFVKGQGQRRRRPSISGSGSQLMQSSYQSYQSMPHTPANYVKAICRDLVLLRTLQTHLKALSPNDSVDTVATTTRQQEKDQEHDEEVTSQGQTTNWLDMATGEGLPDDVQIADTYNDERNPPGSLRPTIDQVKKDFVKDQGQRRRPIIRGSGSQLTQSSYQSTPHTPANYVKAICRDPALLRTLQTHLKTLSPDDLVDTVATTARQQENDQEHDEEATSQGKTTNWLDVATGDGFPDDDQRADTYNDERNPPSILRRIIDQVKKNFVKGQGQRRQRPSISGSGSQLMQSSYQSTPHTPANYVRAICRDTALLRTLQTHLKALSPDDLVDTVATTTRQQEKDQEYDEEVTSQGQTTNWLDMATSDGLPNDVQIADTYNDERNPPGILRRTLDQVKKNFVKGQGQRRRPNIRGSGNQLAQSSNQSTPHTPVDYVKAICRDPTLLHTLQTHLKALSPNDVVDTLTTTVSQQEKDTENDKKAMSQGQTANWLDVTTGDGLPDDVQIADTYNDERNPPGFGSQLTQSSYQSTPDTPADYVRAICRDPVLLRTLQTHLKALSPDDLVDTIATTPR